MSIFLDTDIILDLYLERIPFVKNTEKIIELCHTRKIAGFISPVLVSKIYYILSRGIGKKRAIDTISNLMQFIGTLTMDSKTIKGAIHSGFADFEDALQKHAAEAGKMDLIITRNTKDYKKSALTVMNPETFLKTVWQG